MGLEAANRHAKFLLACILEDAIFLTIMFFVNNTLFSNIINLNLNINVENYMFLRSLNAMFKLVCNEKTQFFSFKSLNILYYMESSTKHTYPQ